MRNERISAGRKVAATLFVAEKELDSAIASAAGLIVQMMHAREEANLPAVIGQDALEALGATVGSLIESRRQMVAAHKGLTTASTQIGLSTISWGDQFPKPEEGSGERKPRIVAVAS